jgi:hypothetical protein
MKAVLLLFIMTVFVFSTSGSELPKRLISRWHFDEAATAKVWPTRGRNDEERERFQKIAAGFKSMRDTLGKSVVGFIDIGQSTIVAHDGLMNPRFEVLSVDENKEIVSVRARHFQVADDDNPKEVDLRICCADEGLIF